MSFDLANPRATQEPGERTRRRPTKGSGARLLRALLAVLACLLCLAPVAAAALFVRAFSVNVFAADEWDLVPLIAELDAGTLGPADLFAQHNEHRYLFSGLALLISGRASAYDTTVWMRLSLGCLALAALLLLLALRSSTAGGGRLLPALVIFVPVPYVLFGLRQHENLLWGNQLTFAFVVLSSVLALLCLHYALGGAGGRNRVRRCALLAAALGGATVAAFSAVQGLLVWPAGLLQLLVLAASASPGTERRAGAAVAGLWALFGAAVWLLYFRGYEKPESTPSALYALEHPAEGIGYFLRLLGGSLFWVDGPALVWGGALGALALAAAALALVRGGLGEGSFLGRNSFWVGLLAFSLFALATITAGRVGFGEERAFASPLASRYAAFSALFVVGLYGLLVGLVREGAPGRARRAGGRRPALLLAGPNALAAVLLAALVGGLLYGVPASYWEGIEAGEARKVAKERSAFVAATHEAQPVGAFGGFGHVPRRVKGEFLPYLEERRYGVFEDREEHLPPSPRGLTLDPAPADAEVRAVRGPGLAQLAPTDRLAVFPSGERFLTVRGVAEGPAGPEDGVGGVWLEVDGRLFPAYHGLEWPGEGRPGFERMLPMGEVGRGAHGVSVVVVSDDGRSYRRGGGGVVFIVGGWGRSAQDNS